MWYYTRWEKFITLTVPCVKHVLVHIPAFWLPCFLNSPLPLLLGFLHQDLASMSPPQTWAQEKGKCPGSLTHTPTPLHTLWVLRHTRRPICVAWLVFNTNFKIGQIKSKEWVTCKPWTVVSCHTLRSRPLRHSSSLKSSFTHWGLCVCVFVLSVNHSPIKTCQTGLIWLKMENIYPCVCP